MYRIEIKAKWNEVTLAVWEVPAFLFVDIDEVRKYVKDHIYKCSNFDECYCCVLDCDDKSGK